VQLLSHDQCLCHSAAVHKDQAESSVRTTDNRGVSLRKFLPFVLPSRRFTSCREDEGSRPNWNWRANKPKRTEGKQAKEVVHETLIPSPTQVFT